MPKSVSLDRLHPVLMRPRVEALLRDPEFVKLGGWVISAFRSDAHQAVLYARALARYGTAKKAGRMVAPPGRSKHGPREPHHDGRKYGMAVDLSVANVKALSGKWPPTVRAKVDAIAARHGLFSPLSWEDWHFEPIRSWAKPRVVGDPAGLGRAIKAAPRVAGPKYPGRPVKAGSKGAAVKAIQSKLKLSADGVFGARTEASVIAFQKFVGLPADGVVGTGTWKALFG